MSNEQGEEANLSGSEKYIKPELFFNKERLAELSKLAIGGRTLKNFSELSGLSEGFLSRLTTGKLNSAPTKRSLVKLMSAKPQNGITLKEIMNAAGYSFEGVSNEQSENFKTAEKILPENISTAAYAPYITALTLEKSGQLEQDYYLRNRSDVFTIMPKQGKDIVGIPAFCLSDSVDVDKEIKEIKWRLMMALSIFKEESKDKFFVIITNQRTLYDNFDKDKIIGTDGEFYIALTEDCMNFSEQRPVKIVDIDGKSKALNKYKISYDLTKAALS